MSDCEESGPGGARNLMD